MRLRDFAEPGDQITDFTTNERFIMTGPTPFDTGAQYEPEYWLDDHGVKLGPVDYDNDESATVLTVNAYPSKVNVGIDLLEVDADLLRPLKIVVNDGTAVTIDEDGTPHPVAPNQLVADAVANIRSAIPIADGDVYYSSHGALLWSSEDTIISVGTRGNTMETSVSFETGWSA